LTKENVKKHQTLLEAGAPNEAEALKKFNQLDELSKMSLWKSFEAERKMTGHNDQWVSETTGPGSTKLKQKLLAGFIMDKGNIGNNYKQFMQGIKVSRSKNYESEWISLEKALRAWGKNELHQRVQSGTILMRKNPKDPRFPEFKEEILRESMKVDQTREFQMTGKGSASVNEAMAMFNVENTDFSWDDFDMDNGEDGGQKDDGSQKFLQMMGTGKKPKKDKDLPALPFDDEKMEKMSTVGKDDGMHQLMAKCVSMKSMVAKGEKACNSIPCDDFCEKSSKQMAGITQSLQKAQKSLDDVINSKKEVTKGAVKAALAASVKALQQMKAWMATYKTSSQGGSSASGKKK
jgi:hypothetical protein